MPEDPETQGEKTESTERIPPGSRPPDDEREGEKAHTADDEKADRESEDSFPASDPPAW